MKKEAALSVVVSSVLLFVLSGCATPQGITKLDASFTDAMRTTSKVTIASFTGMHPSAYGGGIIGAVIEAAAKPGQELHKKCISAMEDVFSKHSSWHYVSRSSLGLPDGDSDDKDPTNLLTSLSKQHGITAFIRMKLIYGMAYRGAFNGPRQLEVMWEVVSSSNEVKMKGNTKVVSESTPTWSGVVDPTLTSGKGEAVFIELAKKNAEQFLDFLKDSK